MKIKIIHSTENKPQVVELPTGKEVFSIGRNETSDIVLSDRSVSRHHAILISKDELFWIEDAGSRGGTKVNGSLITQRQKLSPSDKITIGAFQIFIVESIMPSKTDSDNSIEPDIQQPKGTTLAFMDDFRDSQRLYTQETMNLKNRIHTYVLEKLNLPETALKDLANDEMTEKLEECLDQTLRELRHELPSAIPLPLLRQALLDELIGYGPISPLLRTVKVSEIMINGPNNIFVESKGKLYI